MKGQWSFTFCLKQKKVSSSGLGTIFIWSPTWTWLHKCHFPSTTNTTELFPTLRMNPTLEQVKCRLCLDQHAFLEAYSPRCPAMGCPVSCCSRSRHSAFLRVNREEGTWTGMYEQPSFLRSLPFRFPKSWCARGFYNEKGFVCWRIFSALLLNSKVRRGWGQDENYSPLLCSAFPNSTNLSFQLPWNSSQDSFKDGEPEALVLGFPPNLCDQGQTPPFLWARVLACVQWESGYYYLCLSFLICTMDIAPNSWLHLLGC